MGLLTWLGISSIKDVSEPIDAISNLYTTDKARIESEKDYQDVVQKPILAQTSVNRILAASSDIFNSGWQPMIGWACGILILLYYAPQIIITTIIWAYISFSSGTVAPFPMKPDDLLNLVYLLFGFGIHSIASKK